MLTSCFRPVLYPIASSLPRLRHWRLFTTLTSGEHPTTPTPSKTIFLTPDAYNVCQGFITYTHMISKPFKLLYYPNWKLRLVNLSFWEKCTILHWQPNILKNNFENFMQWNDDFYRLINLYMRFLWAIYGNKTMSKQWNLLQFHFYKCQASSWCIGL